VQHDGWQVAIEKFPHLAWEHINLITSQNWIEYYMDCQHAVHTSINACNNLDTVFADVILGCSDLNIVKNAGQTFQLFENNRWTLDAKPRDLKAYVKRELVRIFGWIENGVAKAGPPLRKDSFITTIANCMIDYLPSADLHPMDECSRNLLLDPTGQVVDFDRDIVRKACAADRLYRCTKRPFSFLKDSELVAGIYKFGQKLKEYHLAGGKTLEPPDEDDVEALLSEPQHLVEMRRDLAALFCRLRDHAESHMLRGLRNIFEDLDDEIFVLKIDSRVLSGIQAFAEFYSFTGIP
jgi:hypothetical protein